MAATEYHDFLLPGAVTRGPGASRTIGASLLAAGVVPGAVLVIADQVVHEHGVTAPLLAGLVEAGYEPVVFAGIAGEPDDAVVSAAITAGRGRDASAVIGIGGGSALDTAKIVAFMTRSSIPLRELAGPAAHTHGLPFLALVPTTVGTGSEATRIAMFAVDGRKRVVSSPQFVPDLAVLDADLVAGLPGPVVAATALDALAHSVESLLSTSSNDLSELFAVPAARTILAQAESAVAGDGESRGELLHASFLAGVALNAGVVLGHSLSYVLAARHNLPHGVGCALSLPYCIAYNSTMDTVRGDRVAQLLLDDPRAGLHDLAVRVAALNTSVDLPNGLGRYGTPEGELSELAARLLRDYPRPTNPVPFDLSRMTTLLTHMRNDDLPGAWTAMQQQQPETQGALA